MNPETASPTPADDRAVTAVARRVGPPLAGVAVVLTAALLAWLALAPTAIAGPLTDAPFTVPATLVLGPDDDGCVRVVAGDGMVTTHCVDELAADDDRDAFYVETFFDEAGDVSVQRDSEDGLVVWSIDPVTGEVLDREQFAAGSGPRAAEGEVPVEVPEPGRRRASGPEVYSDGDLVRRFEAESVGRDRDEDVVVLDVDGPPGYQLRDAVLSPDGAWVVVTTPDDRVVVAPADGSAAPHVWAEVTEDRWVNLFGAIRWDG